MKEYKVVSLVGESDQQSDGINGVREKGFEFLKLVQGFFARGQSQLADSLYFGWYVR